VRTVAATIALSRRGDASQQVPQEVHPPNTIPEIREHGSIF